MGNTDIVVCAEGVRWCAYIWERVCLVDYLFSIAPGIPDVLCVGTYLFNTQYGVCVLLCVDKGFR